MTNYQVPNPKVYWIDKESAFTTAKGERRIYIILSHSSHLSNPDRALLCDTLHCCGNRVEQFFCTVNFSSFND